MLEIEPRFSAGSESTLSYQAVSSIPSFQVLETGLIEPRLALNYYVAKVDLEPLIASVFRVLGL